MGGGGGGGDKIIHHVPLARLRERWIQAEPIEGQQSFQPTPTSPHMPPEKQSVSNNSEMAVQPSKFVWTGSSAHEGDKRHLGPENEKEWGLGAFH